MGFGDIVAAIVGFILVYLFLTVIGDALMERTNKKLDNIIELLEKTRQDKINQL